MRLLPSSRLATECPQLPHKLLFLLNVSTWVLLNMRNYKIKIFRSQSPSLPEKFMIYFLKICLQDAFSKR